MQRIRDFETFQLQGSYGYIKKYQIERYLRRVRIHQILEGINDITRLITAQSLLEKFDK